MPLAGPGKLQLPKGIRGIFRGVLGTVPVIDNSCAEVVAERHRGVSISLTSTLAAAAVTVRCERIRRLSFIAPTQGTESRRSSVLDSTWKSPLRRLCKLFSWWFWGSSSTNIIKARVRNLHSVWLRLIVERRSSEKCWLWLPERSGNWPVRYTHLLNTGLWLLTCCCSVSVYSVCLCVCKSLNECLSMWMEGRQTPCASRFIGHIPHILQGNYKPPSHLVRPTKHQAFTLCMHLKQLYLWFSKASTCGFEKWTCIHKPMFVLCVAWPKNASDAHDSRVIPAPWLERDRERKREALMPMAAFHLDVPYKPGSEPPCMETGRGLWSLINRLAD